jgi:cytochrome P450
MFAAGTDTTSVTLSWILPQLVNNKPIMTRLVEEIDTVVGRDRSCQVSDFESMPLLDAVLNETLRRHPPALVGLPSLVEEPIDLCNGKYRLPTGTFALMNIYGMHHSTEYWDNPMVWNPQRWIDNHDLRKNPAFIPFRVGARSCLGKFVAVAEAKLILVAILQRFNVESCDGNQILLEEKDDVMLNKPQDSLKVRLSRRI